MKNMTKHSANTIKLFLLSALSMFAGTALANPFNTETTQVSGFLSQGYIYSPDNPYAESPRSNGSFNFREAAINGSWEARANLRFAGQVISRKVGDADNGKPKIDFLLADYAYYADNLNTLGVRLGRIKNNYGIYNSTRDIPNARPGISVPYATYFDSFRDLVIATDGISLYGNHALATSELSWEIIRGSRNPEGDSIARYAFGQSLGKDLEVDSITALNIGFTPYMQNYLNFGLSLYKVESGIRNIRTDAEAGANAITPQPNFADIVTGVGMNPLVAVISMQYGTADWLFSAEYMTIYNEVIIESPVPGVAQTNKPRSQGFYLQGQWFATPKFHFMARYDDLILDPNDKNRSDLNPLNQYLGYGQSVTLGSKWLINQNFTLAAEVTQHEGTVFTPEFDAKNDFEFKKHWKQFGLQLTYQF